MNFFYQFTAAFKTHDYGAIASRSPFSLSSVLSSICSPPHTNKIPGYATGHIHRISISFVKHYIAMMILQLSSNIKNNNLCTAT